MSDIPFSYPIDVTSLPPKGRDYRLVAKPDECAAVARALGLESLARLDATLTVAPAAGGSVTVTGRFESDVVQACVITLAPVPAHVGEAIARRFVASPAEPTTAEGERWVDPNDEIMDPIVDGKIDLGEVVTEQLSLAIDPYPKAEGASFAGLEAGGAGGKASPFAALAALKVGKAAPRRGQTKSERTDKKRPAKGKTGG